jgi:hypothetical protein
MGTTKRQLSFYAEPDVDLYLSYMTPGSKTAILNDAIRMRMGADAIVDLNDGRRPQYFAALTELEQSEVRSNLSLPELSYYDVDEHIRTIVEETSSPNWKDNTRRYLTLHNVKYKEPFRIRKCAAAKRSTNL